MTLRSIDPATGRMLAEFPEARPSDVDAILASVQTAQASWRKKAIADRADGLQRVADVLERDREELAELATREMGKPLAQARSEIQKCSWVCEYYADRAAQFLARQEIETDAKRSYVTFKPLGTVLAVMPWNFPYWQVFRFAAPALMAGNGAVLKHAANVTGCAMAIEGVFRAAGLPHDLFRTLVLGNEAVGRVIESPLVSAVTLTGSVRAGKAVAAQAGAALKKTVLELGGSDPYVICEDADLEAAAETCAASRLINSGQSCIAAKRFIVVRSVLQEFRKLLVDRLAAAKVGDPMQEDTDVGPLARVDLRDELHTQVQASVERGAELLLGGEIPDVPGAFYPPTVLDAVKPGMPAFDEETFGPVAALVAAHDEEDAIRLANQSPYGLGAAVFTRDLERGRRLATERIEAGSCFVNAFVKSDPRLPFGGIKHSGYGRELGVFGIREFVNVKTVYVA